jgi:hypothetical protein
MKPLRNLQRGFGRLCLLNVALTTTPREKTKGQPIGRIFKAREGHDSSGHCPGRVRAGGNHLENVGRAAATSSMAACQRTAVSAPRAAKHVGPIALPSRQIARNPFSTDRTWPMRRPAGSVTLITFVLRF